MSTDNKQRRLLMVVPFFPPDSGGGVFRPLSFVKYLPRQGWSTTVVAPRARSYWLGDESLEMDIPPDCAVHRTQALSGQFLLSRLRRGTKPAQARSSGRFSFLRRAASFLLIPDSYAGWYPFAVRAVQRLCASGQFDAIYSTSPPETSHLVARAAHRKHQIPWLADFRDPWMNLHLFPPPTRFHRAIHRSLEKKVCEAEAVVVTTQSLAHRLRQTYPLVNVDVVGNGFDHERFEGASHRLPAKDKMTIVHTGMLTQKRTAVPFLRGLARFLDEVPDARTRLLVEFLGPRESANEELLDTLGLHDVVRFRDSVPHAEAVKTQLEAHLLLLIKHVDTRYKNVIPGKLYEYIGARRPLLALVPEGEASQLIQQLNRGEVVSQIEPHVVAQAIRTQYLRFQSGTLDSYYDLSPRPELTRERRAEHLASILNSIVA